MRLLLIWMIAAVGVTAATAWLLWFSTASSAQFRVDDDRLHVSGRLTLASTERLQTILEETDGVEMLVLGDVAAESDATSLMQKGLVVRGAGLATEVADGVVLSGDAVYLFLAGTERRLGEGAEMVVGDWQSRVGPASALPRDHPAHQERRDYVERMLGSDAFYWYMLEAGDAPVPAAALREFGIVTGG
jgi:hypothetical protein